MSNNKEALVDVMIPLLIPNAGITRGELARIMGVSYSKASQALERLRKHRLLRRTIHGSHYTYTLTGTRRSLSVGASPVMFLN